MQGGVRAVEVIVMEIEREERGAVVTGVVRAGVSPLTSDGLDEAFGLAICLSAIGSGKEMADAQLVAGGGEEPTKSYPPLACGRGGLGLARPLNKGVECLLKCRCRMLAHPAYPITITS